MHEWHRHLEATNSMLKRVTGLDRLRVRGRPVVFSSIMLKVAGWNLLRAASVRSLIAKLTKGGTTGGSSLTFSRISKPPYRLYLATEFRKEPDAPGFQLVAVPRGEYDIQRYVVQVSGPSVENPRRG